MNSTMLLFFVLPTIFWFVIFVIILAGKFKRPNDKVVWILLMIFLPVSAVLFPFIGLGQMERDG